MPLPVESTKSAQSRFRAAFDRLKKGESEVMKRGTPVSQNNVAREAECDPSALRKSRYPELINEIQAFVDSRKGDLPNSLRQEILKKRNKNRTVRQAKAASDIQRDKSVSQLLCANSMIIELTRKLADTQAKLEVLQPSAKKISFNTHPKISPKANPHDVNKKLFP